MSNGIKDSTFPQYIYIQSKSASAPGEYHNSKFGAFPRTAGAHSRSARANLCKFLLSIFTHKNHTNLYSKLKNQDLPCKPTPHPPYNGKSHTFSHKFQSKIVNHPSKIKNVSAPTARYQQKALSNSRNSPAIDKCRQNRRIVVYQSKIRRIWKIETYEDNYEVVLNKARAFFTRAEEVASTDNFDYAIDLYLEGLKLAPDALEDGHAPLRHLTLIRQAKGGKKPSPIDKLKRMGGKTPLDEMLNAEFLLAKDPDNLSYAESMLKACVAGSYTRTADWIAQLVLDANRASSKPSFATYILLKDSYVKMQQFTKAVTACQLAVDLKPNDDALRDELRNLSASMTMEKGGYGKTADFRGSIKNREMQDKLHNQEQTIKSSRFRQSALDDARKRVKEAPTVTNIMHLAQALVDIETEETWTEAVKLLEESYQTSQDFSYKRKFGEVQIRRQKDTLRKLQREIKTDPGDKTQIDHYNALLAELDKTELEHYRLCAQNYPTDLKLKYEYGRCLIKNHKFDEAIPVFQEAQRDPRLRTAALDKTGLCFLLKGWFDDAIDLFHEALKSSPTTESTVAKDIRYNLARAYEAAQKIPEALEMYRKLAQLDFNYKDVSQRIDKLRSDMHNS